MKISLSLKFDTFFGQQLFVCGSIPILGEWNADRAIKMEYHDGGWWSLSFRMDGDLGNVEYKYLLKEDSGKIIWEWESNRRIELTSPEEVDFMAEDIWKNPAPEERVFYTSSFTKVLMNPGQGRQSFSPIQAKKILQFKIEVPRIGSGYKVCVLGNQYALGNWSKADALVLECGEQFPLWTGQIDVDQLQFPLEYKYGIWDVHKKVVVTIEEGNNRQLMELPASTSQFLFVKTDDKFRYPLGLWKAAGVSVPVFSLRSENSFGVGDFSDLKEFIGWARGVGMKMVQILPVNETIASHNWLDSYPYKSISVMALHPIYLNLEKLGRLNDPKLMEEFAGMQQKLNAKTIVDYPEVHRLKSKFYKYIFDQDGEELFRTEAFRKFFESNKTWLVPYAAFVYLRDKYQSADFREWDEFVDYSSEKINQLCSPDSAVWSDIAVHYFIQFHLDKQLKEVSEYARKNGVILKGDIPIGISPNSVEAWTEPHLFNLNAQAGAPPDDFAVKGQNWGFPTYNWEEMVKDGYSWWTKRMQKMADYFDTYRIDHILGFFRIWEVPSDAVEALLGHFNPALPLSVQEIESYSIRFDFDRMTKPYIPHYLVDTLFAESASQVIQQFLEPTGEEKFRLKSDFNTQKKINQYFLNGIEEEDLDSHSRKIRNGLFALASNVLFVKTGEDQWHPRISMQKTSSFNDLDEWTKEQLNRLYLDYFYQRHEDFWYRKGMEKLPAIVSVGNMLVCGEDLGMIPACVPKAMAELGILSLEIQRMPKNPKLKFAHPADAPYLSVCTTSTHDMSTIRGWWEEDREKTQLFHSQELGNNGLAPYYAEPWICQQIITQHLYSPAMWVTIPIQDFIAMDGQLRWEKTQLEQINDPSNVRHKWNYRMAQSIKDLKEAFIFNNLLKELIKASGRDSDY